MLTQLTYALIVASASVAVHHALQHYDAPKKLLHFAKTTQVLHPHLAEVWPNFWDNSTSFIVYNNDSEAVLFTPYEPIAGYKELGDNYYFYSERLPGLTDFHFHINYLLPNNQVATAALLKQGDDAVSESRETLLHEGFHGYQETEFADVERSAFIDPVLLEEASTRAIIALQFALAKQAHESRELTHIRDWLAVRVALSNVIAPQVAAYLGDVERIEGSAHWVGLHGALGNDYRESIDNFSNNFSESFDTTYALRYSAYVTGAVLIDLINDFSESDNDWRQTIERGETPYNLALRIFSFSTEEALSHFNDVIAQYGFSDYLAQAQVTQSDVITPADIEASYPYRLDLTIRTVMRGGRIELPMHFAQGDEGFYQLEPSVIFLPNAKMLQLNTQGIVIDVRNMPILADMSDPIEQGISLTLWSQSPMTTMNNLRDMNELELQFGESIIQSPVGWALDPISTDEHLRINVSLGSGETPKIEMRDQ